MFDLAPVIADIIGSHCPRTHARRDFLRACFQEDWEEVHAMVEGMLAEPGTSEAIRQFAFVNF